MSDENPALLIVDDSEDNRYTLTQRLRRLRYTNVLTAVGGREALALLHQHDVDLVLLDVMMPDVNGYEVLERLRGFSRAPVVALSRCAREEERERLRAAGFDEHLAKPAHLKALRRLIDQL